MKWSGWSWEYDLLILQCVMCDVMRLLRYDVSGLFGWKRGKCGGLDDHTSCGAEMADPRKERQLQDWCSDG